MDGSFALTSWTRVALVPFLYFCTCSFLGWVVESTWRTLRENRLVNSGFLTGPFIPIYGFGALMLMALQALLQGFPPIIAWGILLLSPSVVEYAGSLVLERLFHLKLWDYSHLPFNLQGRICLAYSLVWMLMALAVVSWLQPTLLGAIQSLDQGIGLFLSGMCVSYLLIDMVMSSRSMVNYAAFAARINDMLAQGLRMEFAPGTGHLVLPPEIQRILKPLQAFPHLSRDLGAKLRAMPDWVPRLLEKRLGQLRLYGRLRGRTAAGGFEDHAGPTVQTRAFARLATYPHHDATVHTHVLAVARLAWRIGLAWGLRLDELVRGALLHDYFLYDWRREKPPGGGKHAWRHPEVALGNAERDFGPLTRSERDAILHHMWPLTLVPPLTREGWTVCLADKLVTCLEVYRIVAKAWHVSAVR